MPWIPITKEKPPISDVVLLVGSHWDTPLTGWRVGGDLYRCTSAAPYYEDVTHWQPLPDKPLSLFRLNESDGFTKVSIKDETTIFQGVAYFVNWLNTLIQKGTLKVE